MQIIRVVCLFVASMLTGCALETDALPDHCPTRGVAQSYAPVDAGSGGGGDSHIDSVSRGLDLQVLPSDTVALETLFVPAPVAIDVLPSAETAPNCVQRAIVNNYAGCAAGDPLRFTCDDNPEFADTCRATIDCLARNPVCDRACFSACAGRNVVEVEFYVYRIVTPFCGVQLWHPDVAWGCMAH